MKKVFFLFLFLSALMINAGFAANVPCNDAVNYPDDVGVAGQQRYDAVNEVMEFCNGVNWRLIGAPNKRIAACPSNSSTGEQSYNTTQAFYTNSYDNMAYCDNTGTRTYYNSNCFVTNDSDSCGLLNSGEQRYKDDANVNLRVLQYCNGAYWVNMGSVPGKPCCPDGFIPVPADALTGANQDFCVSKYHMKATTNAGAAIDGYNLGLKDEHFPASRPEGTPWTAVTFNDAANECNIFSGTYDFHIINNPEWMTIAKQIENNTANWSGTGNPEAAGAFIPRGHSKKKPGNALAAKFNDSLGCDGIDPPAQCSLEPTNSKFDQKRTLKLLNDATIWDFSGNVNSWVASDAAQSSLSYQLTSAPLGCAQGIPCTLELTNDYSLNSTTGMYTNISSPYMYPPVEQKAMNKKGFLPANDTIWATGINYSTTNYSQLNFGKITWLTHNPSGTAIQYAPNVMPYRGGYFESQSDAGIYSIWITLNRESPISNIGFRCVYKPTY